MHLSLIIPCIIISGLLSGASAASHLGAEPEELKIKVLLRGCLPQPLR